MDKNYVNHFFMTKKARATEPFEHQTEPWPASTSSIILVEIFGTKSQLLDFVILTVSSKLMSYRQKVKRRLLLPCLIDQETSLVSETSSQFKILF